MDTYIHKIKCHLDDKKHGYIVESDTDDTSRLYISYMEASEEYFMCRGEFRMIFDRYIYTDDEIHLFKGQMYIGALSNKY